MSALEKHFSVKEIAELWGIDGDTVRRIFSVEASVLKLGTCESHIKRKRTILRIPESTLQRVHQRLTEGKDKRRYPISGHKTASPEKEGEKRERMARVSRIARDVILRATLEEKKNEP